MIKPLVIAYPFLHESDACGRIEQQFFSRLSPDTFEPAIVCSAPRGVQKSRNGLDKIIIPESKFVYNLYRVASRLKVANCIFLPDYQKYAWSKRTISRIEQDVKAGKYDYVHTINMPCSAHLIGLSIKKKYGIPWVAQFYDPWANNPYRQERGFIYKKRDEYYETEVAKHADLILHSNQLMIDDWKNTYGDVVETKMSLLPYIIDEREKNTNANENNAFTISHIGNLMGGRTSVVFIKSVARVVASNPELTNRIKVNYVGTTTESEKELIRQEGLDGVFNITGRITDEECNKYFAESDAFLAIDTEHIHNVFFPSKLLNYFYYGKPIIGLCQKESVVRMELLASNNYVFDYGDVDGLAEFLFEAITNKQPIARNDKNYWLKFSAKAVIGQYENLIKNFSI